jgi:hypothetical protein
MNLPTIGHEPLLPHGVRSTTRVHRLVSNEQVKGAEMPAGNKIGYGEHVPFIFAAKVGFFFRVSKILYSLFEKKAGEKCVRIFLILVPIVFILSIFIYIFNIYMRKDTIFI